MEKETLISKLFGMIGKTILSERTMDDYVTHWVMPHLPEDETKTDDFFKSHLEILKSMDGQIRSNVATEIKEFQSKPQTPKEVEPKESDPKQNEPADGDKPAWLKDIENQFQTMAGTVQSLQDEAKRKAQEEARTTLISSAMEMLKKEGATDDLVLSYTKPLLTIREDSTVEDLSNQWKASYNELYAKIKGKGYEPMGAGSMNPNGGKEALLNFKEQMMREGKLPISSPS